MHAQACSWSISATIAYIRRVDKARDQLKETIAVASHLRIEREGH